jgi:transposase-like protein
MENPKCPMCGEEMVLVRIPERAEELNTFKCEKCNIVFVTRGNEDVHDNLK